MFDKGFTSKNGSYTIKTAIIFESICISASKRDTRNGCFLLRWEYTEDEAYEIATANTNDREWGMANSNYMTVASVKSLLKYKPMEKCSDIRIPSLILHGGEDELVRRRQAYEIYNAIPDDTVKEICIMDGIDHNMPIHPRRNEVFQKAAEWFKLYL